MLMRYNVENFLSFHESVEFAMIAGRTRKFPEHTVKQKNIEILKTGIVYGANASGKSNLIGSIYFAQDVILSGVKTINTTNKHFRLSKEIINRPTKFEFEIKCGEKYYSYGFALILKDKRIVQEWLYEIGKNTEKIIFEREEQTSGDHHIDLNLSFSKSADKNRFQVYAEDMKTMQQQLFLTEINNKHLEKIPEVRPFIEVFSWFQDKLIVIFPNSRFVGIPFIGSDEQMNEVFCTFLQFFDTGIEGITSYEQDFEETFKELPEDLKADITKDIKSDAGMLLRVEGIQYALSKNETGEIAVIKLGIQHKNTDNLHEIFELEDESDGTRRLFDLIPALDSLKRKDKVFIIDELDRSLHPVLTKKFVELFLDSTQHNESQLIVSTHESSLLDLKFLRRDEIWFIERNEKGESRLYSLDAYQERYDKEIRKGYLLGRYGAIPVFKHENINTPCGQKQ